MQNILTTNETVREVDFHASNLKNVLVILSGICLLAVFLSSYVRQSNSIRNDSIDELTPKTNLPVSTKGAIDETSVTSVSTLVADAQAFYAMLTPAQQSTLQLTYTPVLAKRWSNLPCGTSCRNGIQLGTNLTSVQYAAAMLVIKDALSANTNDGYEEFYQMNLAEAYLHANGGGSGYDSTLRWIAFLNPPTETGPWMLQFGGHHYAANISFNNGHIIGATPFFMGLEPKTFSFNGTSYDPLGEERKAFANLFASLSTSELSTAHLSSSFNDCTLVPGESNGGNSIFPTTKVGIACSSLTTNQIALVLTAIGHYVQDIDAKTAEAILEVYTNEIANTYIAYTGGGTSGNANSFLVSQGDYVRIDGPSVWIEFSCQGGIVIKGQIHYHTVWRDHIHDYGVNLTGAAIDTSKTTRVTELTSSNSLNVYPNPTNNKISFNLNSYITNGTVTFINTTTGQVVKTLEQFSGQNFQTDISVLSSGPYILKIQSNNGLIYTGKFIKY